MGILSKADRVSLFLFDENKKHFRNSHEWCTNGINPQQKTLQKIDIEIISWWINQIEKLSFINIRDVSTLPKEAQTVKRFMEIQNISSFLAFPIYTNRNLMGFTMELRSLKSCSNFVQKKRRGNINKSTL